MSIFLLVECDLHHGEVRVHNLGHHSNWTDAVEIGEQKALGGFDNFWKVIEVNDGGLLVDTTTGEAFGQYANPIRIHSD
jgi:hypothetical protein